MKLTGLSSNLPAQALLRDVFEVKDRAWRGIGVIPRSGYGLREAYAGFDAERIFEVEAVGRRGFPFFNLYRLMVILRGEKLIADAGGTRELPVGARLAMACFRFLFRFNGPGPGWQLLAVARKP